MSVIFYEADELAAVASLTVGNLASDQGKRDIAWIVDDLAEYSQKNAEAFRATYPADPAQGMTAEQITAEIRPIYKAEQIQTAKRVLAGMRYNLIANNGTDFASVRTLGLILHCTQRCGPRFTRTDPALALRRIVGMILIRWELEEEQACFPGAALRRDLRKAIADFDNP